MLLEERQHPVVEQIRRRNRCLAVIQLGEANLGAGVDEGGRFYRRVIFSVTEVRGHQLIDLA